MDITKFTAAFVKLLERDASGKALTIVVGRDARMSGFFVNQLVCGTLQAMGAHVIDIGLSTTPTVEVAVAALKGGMAELSSRPVIIRRNGMP